MKVSISGIRGVYTNDDLSLYEVVKFSRLFAQSLVNPGQKCILGRDTRPSSMAIAKIVAASLMQEGVDIYDLNVAPTPMVFRESRKYQAGCIVTASHNPLEWNGLKFILEGRGIFQNELHIMLNSMPSTEKKLTRVYGKLFQPVSNYVNEIVELLKQSENSTNSTDHIKVGLDPGGGAACGYV